MSIDNVSVHDWTSRHVSVWLERINLSQYCEQFECHNVSGSTLLQLDSTRLKVIGVNSSKDRDQLKKRLKDMRAALERERKQSERDQKLRERLSRQVGPQKTSPPGGPIKKRKFFGK
jgi:neurabin